MLATCICLNGSLLDQLSCTIGNLFNEPGPCGPPIYIVCKKNYPLDECAHPTQLMR